MRPLALLALLLALTACGAEGPPFRPGAPENTPATFPEN